MPHPPKKSHPLRAIRTATTFPSHSEFARHIGVSSAAIQAIERGKLSLTPKLAARIREITGASDRELLKGITGRARTLSGAPYTSEWFAEWTARREARLQMGNRQREDSSQLEFWLQILLAAAGNLGGGESLQKVRSLVAEHLDQIQADTGLLNAINDLLPPYQSVETRCATVGTWKAGPLLPGATHGIAMPQGMPAKTRLTISLQTSPCWVPQLPPPRPARGNLELIPTCFFVVAVGGVGCELAAAWWGALSMEHGIDPATGVAIHGAPTGNWQGFFRKLHRADMPERYVARGMFLDLGAADPSNLGKERGGIFSDEAFLSGTQSSEGIFAGPHHSDARFLRDEALQLIRRQSDDTAGPGGIFLLHSLDGGTGSGLTSQLLENLQREMPQVPAVSIAPLSMSANTADCNVLCNQCMALSGIASHAAGAIFFNRERLAKDLNGSWRISTPEGVEVNGLICEMLCAITAPLRYPSHAAAPWQLGELLAAMKGAEDGPVPFFSARALPLASLLKGPRIFAATKELVSGALGRLPRVERNSGEPISLFLRARAAEGNHSGKKPCRREFRLTSERRIGTHESLTLVRPQAFQTEWKPLVEQVLHPASPDALAQWSERAGVPPSRLREAVSRIAGVEIAHGDGGHPRAGA